MYLPKLYDPAECKYRIRYAVRTILRDRLTNECAFNICFEMGDGEDVILAILRRGPKNPQLRLALEQSRLVDLTHWLISYPALAAAYHADDDVFKSSSAMRPSGNVQPNTQQRQRHAAPLRAR